MASKGNGLLPLLAIGAALYYFSNISRKNTYVSGIKAFIQGAEIKGGNLLIYFKFQNSNTMPSTIRSVVGDVLLNGNKLAAVSSFTVIEIKGNAETIYPVTLKLNIATAVNTLAQLAKNMAGSTLQFKGYVNINGTATPVTINFAIK